MEPRLKRRVLANTGCPVQWSYNHIVTPRIGISLVFWHTPAHHHNRFTAPLPGPPGWAGARRELLDFMMQGEINRGRQTDHPAGRQSIRTNQCQPQPPIFFYRPMSFLPPNQQCQSTEGMTYTYSIKQELSTYVIYYIQKYAVKMFTEKHDTYNQNSSDKVWLLSTSAQ